MGIYQLSPINKFVQQATPGLPTYLIGSLNRTVAATKMTITAVQSNGTQFIYFVTVTEGQLPVAGQLFSAAGCAIDTQFNVTNVAIASVSFTDTPEDGIGTVTLTKSGNFRAKTADVGYALAPQVEVGELFSSLSTYQGAPFDSSEVALQDNTGPDNAFTIRAEVGFPVLPGACTVDLYGADFNVDTDYYIIGTVAVVTGGALVQSAISFTGIRARFLRFHVSAIAAPASAKLFAKVLV